MGYKGSHFVYAANISISSGVPVNGKLASSSSENTYQFTITKDGEGHIPHANGKKLGETTTNGEYLIKIPKQKAGTVITVYIVGSAGSRSVDKTVIVRQ
ncbi:hypothetical protein ABDH65_17435 [Heyndrickxia ginsengihumi]|uniref:hypothetical protein n=1 Tax=Heyndrickxia ginsengihumi TaxID=363870 RepID=UPI003D22C0F0